MRYIGWNYACDMLSAFYETHRVPETRGQFGQFPLAAMVLACSPFLWLIMALSAFNYVTIGYVLKTADEGPIVYHRFEIFCDFAAAGVNMIPHLDLGVAADWLYYVFTGK